MNAMTLDGIERETWARQAGAYNDLFAPVSSQAINATLDGLGSMKGRRHLDIACGTGHLVAAAVARGAESEGLDFTGQMVEIARSTYPQARFHRGEATELPFDNGRFDAVTCTFGLSHMEDPAASIREAFRVLKSGGIFAFTLWYGPDDGNEMLSIVKTAVERYAETDTALPDSWTRLRFAHEEKCRSLTDKAGFRNTEFRKLPIRLHAESPNEIVAIVESISIRTRHILERQDPSVREHILKEILLDAESRRSEDGIGLALPALLTIARKPPSQEEIR